MGKDLNYATYPGKIGYVRVVLGHKAYYPGKDFNDDKDDPFGYIEGEEEIKDDEEDRPDIPDRKGKYESKDDEIIDTSSSSKPAVEVEVPSDNLPEDVSEYGYGFWFRYLTTYPDRLNPGKNAPWYFLARLTTNIPHADIAMGDRILAIW